jgi:translation initiation factor 1
MSKKKKPDLNGFVFSTDPDFQFEQTDPAEQETLAPGLQLLRVKLDTKQRGGKMVTLVEGFTGTAEDAGNLGKQLKNFCGTGGSVKDGEILIQGDQREKVLQYLLKNGYSKARKG